MYLLWTVLSPAVYGATYLLLLTLSLHASYSCMRDRGERPGREAIKATCRYPLSLLQYVPAEDVSQSFDNYSIPYMEEFLNILVTNCLQGSPPYANPGALHGRNGDSGNGVQAR